MSVFACDTVAVVAVGGFFAALLGAFAVLALFVWTNREQR